jgi:hypothetical protein
MFFKGCRTKAELGRAIATSANNEQLHPSGWLRRLSLAHQMLGLTKKDFVRCLPENPYATMYIGLEDYKYIEDVENVSKQILRNEYITRIWHLAAYSMRDGNVKLDELLRGGHFRTWESLEKYLKQNKEG